MAKPVNIAPAAPSNGVTVRPLAAQISHLDDMLADTFAEYTVTKKLNGRQTIVGKTHDGQTVALTQYKGNGVREQSISTTDGEQSIEARRAEALRLRMEKNLSQQEIATQLGVSQKTISDDLRAAGAGRVNKRL